MNNFNLSSELQEYIKSKKIKSWTKIQEEFLTNQNNKKNLVGISPTGSGKTLAFLLPTLNKINLDCNEYQAVVVCPTRELATQIDAVINEIKVFDKRIKSELWIGGIDLNKIIKNANNKKTGQIIVCTPQRFLEVRENLTGDKFNKIKVFGLDEADMLLELNFMHQINKIGEYIKIENRNIWKFATSATLHELLNNELKKLYKNIFVINANTMNTKNREINVKHYLVENHDKEHALWIVLNKINPYFCIIFVNTKQKADEIYKKMLEQNYNVLNLHGGLKTRERKNNYREIRRLNFQYVVASDLASRGLDIDGASHVISYDLPLTSQWYIHRSGRVGRGKYTGESYVLCAPSDANKIDVLNKKKNNFLTLQIKNNELVVRKEKNKPRWYSNTEESMEIKKVIATSGKKVKPGYKKKLKQEIKKIEQKYKRRYIDKIMKEKIKK